MTDSFFVYNHQLPDIGNWWSTLL